MNIDLLNIENDVVVPGIECYTIDELKTIMSNYSKENALEIFTYLHFLYHPKSAFNNIPEKDRQEQILDKVRTGDWSEDESDICACELMIKKLFLTPTRRFFQQSKQGLERLGNYIATAEITDGKDGNFSTLSMNYTRLGKIMEDFKKIEKMVEDEETIQMRGDQEISMV